MLLRHIKIHQNDLGLVLRNQDVLGLDISVHYLLLVQVVDTLKDLLEKFLGVLLGVSAGAGDFVKDFRSVDELYNLVNNVFEVVDKDLLRVHDVLVF